MQHGDVNAESSLALVREEIDRIDARILSLLSRRGELALKARDI
jgi:chorismate mutase